LRRYEKLRGGAALLPPTVLGRQWCDVEEAASVDAYQLAFCIRMPVSTVIVACLVDAQTSFEPFLKEMKGLMLDRSLRLVAQERA
jgi:hypothetical protein